MKIQINSDSEPGKLYEVDLIELTCSCTHFSRRLKSYDIDEPERICKHLARALLENGIPSQLKKHRKLFEKRATPRAHPVSHYKPKIVKEKLSYGCIRTIKKEVLEKTDDFFFGGNWMPEGNYFFLKGQIENNIIEVAIEISRPQTLEATICINGSRPGYMSFLKDKPSGIKAGALIVIIEFERPAIPRKYKHMDDAIKDWIEGEFYQT